MNVAKIIPTAPEVLREVAVLLAGAFVATMIVRGLPPEWRDRFTWFPQ